jgi:hypothetical protein
MTRFLSQALGAPEPDFRIGLQKLENANGNPSSDIRLSSRIQQDSRRKLMELGLDPRDTTAKELYQALRQRVKADDARLKRRLQTESATHVSAEADTVAGMVHVIKALPDSKRCFALKPSRLKAIIKAVPPKKAMKQLGYRSLDSMLKHEQPVLILAAAWLTEGEGWQKRLLDQYKKLAAADFENRSIALLGVESERWRRLSKQIVEQNKHNLICFKELGAIVFLPLPADIPDGAVTASLGLALHELNEIRACSTFLKICQVKADFGHIVRTIAGDDPKLSSTLLDQPVPWHLVHRYYSRLADRFREDIFEPYLQMEDMVWHETEETLASIEPSLNFWDQTAHLGLMDGSKPVSFNVVDMALSICNKLPYEQRVVHYFQRSLWHELLISYMNHQPVEATVLAEIEGQPAGQKALA